MLDYGHLWLLRWLISLVCYTGNSAKIEVLAGIRGHLHLPDWVISLSTNYTHTLTKHSCRFKHLSPYMSLFQGLLAASAFTGGQCKTQYPALSTTHPLVYTKATATCLLLLTATSMILEPFKYIFQHLLYFICARTSLNNMNTFTVFQCWWQ